MRKIFMWLILLCFSFSVLGCDSNMKEPEEYKKLNDITNMIKAHDYESVISLSYEFTNKDNEKEFNVLKNYALALKNQNDSKKFNEYIDAIPNDYKGRLSESIKEHKVKLNKQRLEEQKYNEQKIRQKDVVDSQKEMIKRLQRHMDANKQSKSEVKIDYNKPFIDYSNYKDNQTMKNYSFLYDEEGTRYMFKTMGDGLSKKAFMVNQYDIEDIRRGLISDADLGYVICSNYIFGNIIHCVYKDGDAIFVVICNSDNNSFKVYGRNINSDRYTTVNNFRLLGIQKE